MFTDNKKLISGFSYHVEYEMVDCVVVRDSKFYYYNVYAYMHNSELDPLKSWFDKVTETDESYIIPTIKLFYKNRFLNSIKRFDLTNNKSTSEIKLSFLTVFKNEYDEPYEQQINHKIFNDKFSAKICLLDPNEYSGYNNYSGYCLSVIFE